VRPQDAAVQADLAAPIAVIDDPSAEVRDPDHGSVLAALRTERGNVRRTAASLGISRGRLYRLMEKLGTVDLELIRQEFPPQSSDGKPT
jgi:transcriptional regulator of acetoin/glycerol metabolism